MTILKLSNDRLYPVEKDLAELSCRTFNIVDYARKTGNFAGQQRPSGITFSGSILKDISSHMILLKIQDNTRENILIIRNPISVAISKEGYGKWHNESDIDNFLSRSPILQKFGSQFSTQFIEYVFIWCLIHRIILPMLAEFDFFTIFYENLLREPE